MKVRALVVSLLFFAAFTVATPISAASEKIADFTSNIKINSDGTVIVAEIISYDFGTAAKHGIYREIPVIKKNTDGKKYKMTITVLSVTDEKSNAYTYTTTNNSGTLSIKIGDANKTITGKHIYKINYIVAGALTYFSEHDELYWNVTGNDWDIPITQAQANILLPSTENISLRAACYTGYTGSTATECTAQTGSGRFTFKTTRGLSSSEGLTLVASFPKGMVAVLEPVIDNSDTVMSLFGMLVAFGLFVWNFIVPIKVIANWYPDYKLTKSAKIVAAWFDPPKDAWGQKLSPAQTAALVAKEFNPKIVTATIISLAQRGYLKIKQLKPKEFELTLLKAYYDTADFEQDLLNGIFSNGTKATVNIKSLKNNTKYGNNLEKFYVNVSKSLVTTKLFEVDPKKSQDRYNALTAVAFSTLAIILGVVAYIFGRKAAKKTALGVEKYGEAKSLYNFLVSQNDQLDFQAKNQMFFEKLLPYASAFGVEDVWVKRFKDLQFVNPDWYEGNNFNTLAFVAFSHNFSASMKSAAISATQSSTGHSSGFSGGSSGGGGGGGGGGSW